MYKEISYKDYQENVSDDNIYIITDFPQPQNDGVWSAEKIQKETSKQITNEIKKLKQMLSSKVTLVHNCQNCGATLDLEENKPIFHCKYCGSTYVIGTQRLMQTY